MQNAENKKNNEDIKISDLISILWSDKYLIITISFITLILFILYAFLTPNEYTSKATLVPTLKEESLSSKLGAYSSLVGLAGVQIPGENASKSIEAIETIKSYQFFSSYFLPNINLEDIAAVSNWDEDENKIIYVSKLFDDNTKSWRTTKKNKSLSPSIQQAYEIYLSILSIYEDQTTLFVKLSITHKSPHIAKEWVELIIEKINSSMREEDRQKAKNAIEFLNDLGKSTNVQTINEVISGLLENQMQTLMLINSNEDYIYKILDAPIAPEMISAPKRILIIFFGAMLGFMLSLTVVFLKFYVKKINTE